MGQVNFPFHRPVVRYLNPSAKMASSMVLVILAACLVASSQAFYGGYGGVGLMGAGLYGRGLYGGALGGYYGGYYGGMPGFGYGYGYRGYGAGLMGLGMIGGGYY